MKLNVIKNVILCIINILYEIKCDIKCNFMHNKYLIWNIMWFRISLLKYFGYRICLSDFRSYTHKLTTSFSLSSPYMCRIFSFYLFHLLFHLPFLPLFHLFSFLFSLFPFPSIIRVKHSGLRFMPTESWLHVIKVLLPIN